MPSNCLNASMPSIELLKAGVPRGPVGKDRGQIPGEARVDGVARRHDRRGGGGWQRHSSDHKGAAACLQRRKSRQRATLDGFTLRSSSCVVSDPSCAARFCLHWRRSSRRAARDTQRANRCDQRPILILISIDGWRWDYLERFAPPALSALAARGVRAEGLIPSFPSKTFPNHYTIVTGLYPDRHGIVSNTMRDPALPGLFSLVQRRRAAGHALVGRRAALGDRRAAGPDRRDDVLAGIGRGDCRRPPDATGGCSTTKSRTTSASIRCSSGCGSPRRARPTFFTLYFSDVDSAGHDFGPESPEMRRGGAAVDAGDRAARQRDSTPLALSARTNLVLVSDHGMAQIAPDRVIVLDDYVDSPPSIVIDWVPILGVTPRGGSVDELYQRAEGQASGPAGVQERGPAGTLSPARSPAATRRHRHRRRRLAHHDA